MVGCSALDVLNVRSQSPEERTEDPAPRLVGDMAASYGMFPIRIDGLSIVTGLSGTGGDPAPSPQRAAMLEEMHTRGVKNPNEMFASKEIALVAVSGVLRPGIRKGDRFDIELRTAGRSDAASIRGGYLLETRMKQMAALGGQMREGHPLATAEGPVMIDPAGEGKKDHVMLTRGRVLGGGETRLLESASNAVRRASDIGYSMAGSVKAAASKPRIVLSDAEFDKY